MMKQLKCYYLLLIRYYKSSLLNQFLEGYSIMAAWGNNFFKKIFFLLFFHFSAPLKCHWPIRASSLKSHSPAGRIYSPLATGRVLMKRLKEVCSKPQLHVPHSLEDTGNRDDLKIDTNSPLILPDLLNSLTEFMFHLGKTPMTLQSKVSS